MAGTPKNYNTAKTEIGPWDIWLDVAVPGAGARITLATDGTPDATANPNAKHFGHSENGGTITYTPNITEFEADEVTAAILVQNIKELLGIQANALQILDTQLLSYLMPGGTRNTGSGYEEIAVGGKLTVPTFSVVGIAPIYADVTKFLVMHLYKAYNKAGLKMDITRKKMASSPSDFTATAISSRAAGDQLGKIWISV